MFNHQFQNIFEKQLKICITLALQFLIYNSYERDYIISYLVI